MEGAITSFAVEKLGELIISEANLLSGVRVQMDQLRTELTRVQGFLQKFDSRREDQDPTVINYIVEIRGVAYDAEDIIETYILKVQSRRGGGVLKFLKRCASILSEGAVLHKIGMDIQSLNNTITDITRSAKTYGIDLTRDEEVSSSNYDKHTELRRSYGHVEEEGIVGLHNDVQKLSRLLVHSENHITIWGMGGLGKTTLAKKVYHDGLVRSHFDCFSWICISQNWEIKDVFQALLIAFKSTSVSSDGKTEIYRMRTEELAQQLYELQEKNKCLVVLDDVWSAEALRSISAAFPKRTRSKIVLTTRIRDVAQGIRLHMDGQVVIHELQTLGDGESKELFWKKALSTNSIDLSKELKEETEKKVLNHCGGLPLAIVVLGGLLSQMETPQDWKKVVDDIPSYLSDGEGRVMQVLALSYWNLPYYLKPCFLYLGQYQEDAEINVESLVRKWVAEGIVSSKHRVKKTLVEVARDYVHELAGRCMVQTGVTRRTGRIKYCRLHDVVREFCLTKLDEQKDFLKIIDFRAGVEPACNTASKVRRLAIYMDGPSNIDADGYIKDCISNPHLRSLSYSITEDVQGHQPILLKGLQMLRTLNIEGDGFERLPKIVGRLLHLRYLSLREYMILNIPSSIGNLRCLQTLDLRHCFSYRQFGILIMPNVLWKMEQLTHLYLPRKMQSGDHPKLLRLDTLGKLETLINFDTKHVSVNCLSKLGNLRKLKAYFNDIEDVSVILGSPSVVNNQLQHSNLSFKITEETQAQVCQLLRCHHLRQLELRGRLLKLPRWHEFPHAIVYLRLEDTELKEDPMPTLEKLPQLRALSLGDGSFVENEIVCSCASENIDCGFPRLVQLELSGLRNLEDWKVEKGAMPNLQSLFIGKCLKLKQVPEGLRYITTLMELHVFNMGEEFDDMLKEGGRDYYKVQHIPQVRIVHF